MNQSRTVRIDKILPRLIEAGLKGNTRDFELLTLTVIRTIKNENSPLATELSALLGHLKGQPNAVRRVSPGPAPSDTDGGLSLVQISNPEDAEEPILEERIRERVKRLLLERTKASILIQNGISPPGTILLKGQPGTGKTMLANWIAAQLHLSLVTLDLATSMSSFLGKTGQNLRRSLDYARSFPCLLLLDEFDAIGKRRDDPTEIGELKRIVNVLLKELENWPVESILVAATNHPELLDPAIHRRFDVVIDLPLPGPTQREAIIRRACLDFSKDVPDELFHLFTTLYEGLNGSEIDTRIRGIIRKHLLDDTPLATSLTNDIISEVINTKGNRKKKSKTIEEIAEALVHKGLTLREIAAVTGYSHTNIQYHLNKEKKNGRK